MKQEWKLGNTEEMLPDGSILIRGSRRKDGSYRKSTRKREGFVNDEDQVRGNVYKVKQVRMRNAGKKYVEGVGIVENDDARKQSKAQAQKQRKKQTQIRKAALKLTLLHLIQPFCETQNQPDRFFAYKVVETMCKSKNLEEIQSLVDKGWEVRIQEIFTSVMTWQAKTAWKELKEEATRYLYTVVHEIECWELRRAGCVELSDAWLQEIKDKARHQTELKTYLAQKKKRPHQQSGQAAKPKPKTQPCTDAKGISAENLFGCGAEESVASAEQKLGSEGAKKELKKLRKKLRSIQKVAENQKNGKALNPDELKKLATLPNVENQIRELEAVVG